MLRKKIISCVDFDKMFEKNTYFSFFYVFVYSYHFYDQVDRKTNVDCRLCTVKSLRVFKSALN